MRNGWGNRLYAINVMQCLWYSFSTSAKETVLLYINQQTILTPDEIANSTYIYTTCLTRAWSATVASASQPALIPESSTSIGYLAWPSPSHGQSINMHLWARIRHSRIYTRNKWTLNLQATLPGDYQHHTRPPHGRPMSIEWAPHAMSASAYLTDCIASRRSKLLQRRPTTIQHVPLCNGLASSPYQRFVTSSPFQG
jgi:hypothetical protein